MRHAIVFLLVLGACGSDDDDLPPNGEPGHFMLTGTVRYEDRPQLASGKLAGATPKLARGVQVTIINEPNNAIVATTVTDDNGVYTVEFDGFTNNKTHVLVSATSTVETRPINVRHAKTEVIHGFGGPTFDLQSGTQDVLVPESSGVAEAFNIFDNLVDVMDQIPTLFPGRNQLPVTAFWHEGNNDGTYYFDNGLYLLGEASDSDGYDDTVILHEAGHWIEEVIGRSDSPGGDHDGSPTNPTLAWSEGFSTYFSMAITNKPIYGDSNAGGGFSFNADLSNTKANGAGSLSQPVSEDMIAEILWDLADAPGTDDDGVDGTHPQVLEVEAALRFATLRGGAGVNGVDLVDYLDNYLRLRGLSKCTGIRALIDVKHTFPYDYPAPNANCP
jgi:hypothetical protein